MISEQLRQAVERCKKPLTQVAAGAGIPQPVLHRFMKKDGGRDIYLKATADKLAAYFGLELRPVLMPDEPAIAAASPPADRQPEPAKPIRRSKRRSSGRKPTSGK